MNQQADQLVWKKSTRSSDGSGQCVEVASTTAAVHVRDSKNQQGPALTFEPTVWTAFVNDIKAGKLDLA